MNTSRLKGLGTLPMALWHRFHIWRARRMYLRIVYANVRALSIKAHADYLMRKHAEDPQSRLPLGDD